jgi:hypothetical protein
MRAQRRYLTAVRSRARRLAPPRRPKLHEALLLAAAILLVVIVFNVLG